MGYKVFTCVICNKQVSRRKSFDLQGLNGKEGRACRDHPEVIEMVRKKLDEAEMLKRIEEEMKKGERILRVIAASAYIRVTHTVHGVDPDIIYSNFRRSGMPDDMIEEVKAQVENSGGPLMSIDELLNSMAAFMSALKKSPKS